MKKNSVIDFNLVDDETLAREFNITIFDVARLRRRGLIPCYRLSRKMIRFNIFDVRCALEKLRQPEVAV